MQKGKKAAMQPEEQERFARNLKVLSRRLQEELLSGEELYQLLRKVREQERYPEFTRNLREKHAVLYEALNGTLLPSWNTVYKYTVGGEPPTRKFVQDVADFCTKVFSFDTAVLTQDLLSCEVEAFPALRRERKRWSRYEGIYRCFYHYPDALKGTQPPLHGGLMQLREREEDGALCCRLVTGIRREERFEPLTELMEACPGGEGVEQLRAYSDALPEYEGRLVCYEGLADFEFQRHFMMRMHRVKHKNGVLVLMRRWDDSAQRRYTGGIATVTLIRGDGVTVFPMAITRQEMTFSGDGVLLKQHLREAQKGERGLSLSKQMDKDWNQSVMDWGCLHAGGEL